MYNPATVINLEKYNIKDIYFEKESKNFMGFKLYEIAEDREIDDIIPHSESSFLLFD